jgi:uncharacterized protein YbjT (DUF2867 family)
MYVITGATGNTGSVVARALLEAGREVRVLVRDPAKAEPLARLGAQVVQGELGDGAAVARAFAGAKGIYLMSPPDLTSNAFLAERKQLMTRLVNAAREARAGHVVLLSSVGAQHAGGTGPIETVAQAERALEASGLPATFVRAAYFMENWGSVLPVARKDGVLPSFLPASLTVPMVATRDIGQVAARALLEGPRGRRVIELAGPRELTPAEVATAAGRVLGKPVTLVEAPLTAVVPTFTSFGLSADIAGLFREMYQGLISGKVAFEGGAAEAVRGPTEIDTVLAGLLGKG